MSVGGSIGIVLLFCVVLLSGCISAPVLVSPAVPTDVQSMGCVTGKAAGALGIVDTTVYFFSFDMNSRWERAYADALAKAPGATALRDVTIREDWYWLILVTLRVVTIRGEAVR
jgi:hypothetical protein